MLNHALEILLGPGQRILENLPAGVYTCDSSGLITGFNEFAQQLWGRAPKLNDPVDRFCGSFRLYLPDGSPISHNDCWMALALQTGRAYNGETIVIERPDGSRRTVLANANPLFDAAGQLVGGVNILVDITDRTRAEEAQRWLAAIVEFSEDAIISKTLDGRILSWNAGAERLFGYSAGEVIGQPITLLIPPERQHEEQSILERLRKGERIEHFETERVTKDGRYIAISLTISPVRDASGSVVAASKVARDITSQREVQTALLTLTEKLAGQVADLQRLHEMSLRLASTHELPQILERALSAAMAIDGADFGLLCLCNPETGALKVGASSGLSDDYLKLAETTVPSGETSGRSLHELQRVIVEDTETDVLFAPYREAARRAGFRAVHSTPLITRHGNLAGVLSTHFKSPHRPSDREMRLIDLCARQAVDFIENARLYAALREADQRKDEFLAVLAHELRNPLAPISYALQVLRLSDELGPAAGRMCEIMQRQVTHLSRLVDDLLEVSRITRGKIELRREHVNLVSVIGSAVETSKPLIESQRHQLMISLSPEPMLLEADPVRLSQVIANLLNNAAKYTERGGQIWLTARREDGEAVISVRDTGVGIAAEMLPRVFELFAQVDRTLQRAHGGLGIGLNLARSLVQLHGGTIEARSGGLGAGSEFLIRIPLLPNESPRPERLAAGLKNEQLPSRRILIVDDTRAAAYMLGKLLEALGQTVEIVHDGQSALARVQAHPPEIIFSDIAMPKMDGYELARRLRRNCTWPQPVLVALTGYGQESDRERTESAGFDHHLVKPVSLDALQQLLRSVPSIVAHSRPRSSGADAIV